MRFSRQRNGVGCGDQSNAGDRFVLGQIVQVLRGTCAGEYAIIIRKDNSRTLWLVNKDRFTIDHPKQKNVKHVQPTNWIAEDILEILQKNGRLTDAMLRYALNQYLLQRKGE
ncbi:KOW domain-containing RNA-binding protein [Risungbinella massiliensis]|uniref:KOW domain-containing RNA-binding protein n=1 Tax=Risungbinella massiliensis TaxID=1329796 RepID=UPI001E2AF011|nr:KOW domain-containing RNA-binding protein [Risungbinella massiliensis]